MKLKQSENKMFINIEQDEILIAYDIFRMLKGLEYTRFQKVLWYLRDFRHDYLLIDFDESLNQRKKFPEEKET